MKKILLVLILFLSKAHAEEVFIPEELKDWKSWVEQAHPEWNCAKYDSRFTCDWPGKLSIDISESGAKFSLKVSMLAQGLLPLPSKKELKPSEIEVKETNGNLISPKIILKDSQTFLKLDKGDYEITGSFSWSEIPKNLPIPDTYAMLEVKQSGEEMQFNRTNEGAWLKDSDNQQIEKSLFLSVFRKITDSSPLIIETLIKIRATGAAHTINFGKILPSNSIPISTNTVLSHQLTPEGNLTIQIKPGNYDVYITSTLQQPVSTINAPKPSFEHWPEYEVWSMQDNKNFRSVEFIGGKAVTASNTELPAEWTGGATYYVSPSEEIKLKELNRGITREEQNALSLNRQMWLDLDGSAFTISDNITAQFNSGFRLNATKGLELGRAQINNQDQQITIDPNNQNLGIEIRDRNININAVSRLKYKPSVPALGWNSTVSSFYGTLNLGPSWKLLHISGAQNVTGSWLSSWSLMDLFVGILISVASFKLYGKNFSAMVLAALLLNKGEYLEPRLMMIHLVIAVLIYKLTREATDYWKKISSTYLFATFSVWLIMVATFSKLQLTQLLFPQLQSGTRYRTLLQELLFFIEGWFLSWPSMGMALLLVVILINWVKKSAGQFQVFLRVFVSAILIFSCIPAVIGILAMFTGPRTFGSGVQYANEGRMLSKSAGAPAASSEMFSRGYDSSISQDENKSKFDTPTGKLLQTGPALPNWAWRSFSYSLDGPVSPEREIKFYLIRPSIERLLSLIRMSLLILISLALWKNIGFKIPKIANSYLAIIFILSFPSLAKAEYPSDKILNELSSRLENKLCQSKECATIEKLNLEIIDNNANIKISYTSDGSSGLILPGPLDQLQIKKVEQDGNEINSLRRNENNFLIVKTINGRHTLNIQAKLAGAQVTNLEFPNLPLKTSIDAKNWQIDGLLPGGLIKGTLQLTPSNSDGKEVLETILPTWFTVTRRINLGDKFNIITSIAPLRELPRPTTVKFKSLDGEKIASEKATLSNGIIEARFDTNMSELIFESSLTPNENLILKANNDNNVTEYWEISCNSLYSCKNDGIAPNNLFQEDKYSLSWFPFPNEEVKIKIKALNSAEGDLLTVDNLTHSTKWGTDLLQGSITARIRNTEQKTLNFTIPHGAKLNNLTLDNAIINSVSNNNEHSILVSPGEHDLYVGYDTFWKPSIYTKMPAIKFDAKLHNVNLQIGPSSDRWILYLGGLVWGPAVLFWPKLLIIILIIFTLTKQGYLPLSNFGSVMLSLGLAVLPTIFMAIPLLWLAVINAPKLVLEKTQKLNTKLRLSLFAVLSIITICLLYRMIHSGLILEPPMLIVGNRSIDANLNWFIDHSSANLPQPWVISLPIWCWRVLMLVWSTWLVVAVLSWTKKAIDAGKTLA